MSIFIEITKAIILKNKLVRLVTISYSVLSHKVPHRTKLKHDSSLFKEQWSHGRKSRYYFYRAFINNEIKILLEQMLESQNGRY